MMEWQTENIRQELRSSASGYGSCDDTLGFCRSMRNRRRLRNPTQMPGPEIMRLKSWVEDHGSSIIVARARGIRSSSMDFATDFLDAVIESQTPIIWAFPSSFADSPTPSAVLQSLVLQTMNLSGSASAAELPTVSIQDIRNARSPFQWFTILERCLMRLDKLFIVIDMNLIQRSLESANEERNGFTVDQFLERLRSIVHARTQGWIKVVLISWSSDSFDQPLSDSLEDVIKVYTDRGIVQERKFWNPRLRGLARRNTRVSSQHLRLAVGLPFGNQGRLHPT